MNAPCSRPWISIAIFLGFATVALSDTPKAEVKAETKAAAKAAAKAAGVQTMESQAAMTPAKALEALKEGNKRFVAGTSIQKNLPAKVKATSEGQYPFAAVLSCMDSRAPAEAVFDQSIGDIFSIRVAGNVVDPDVLGSLEYAAKVIGVKSIVVVGHTSCGAVKGAIDKVKLGHLTQLCDKIQPAVAASGAGTTKDYAYVDKVGEQNVRQSMKEIREKSPILKEMIDSGSLGLAGANYDVSTGVVTFFAQ